MGASRHLPASEPGAGGLSIRFWGVRGSVAVPGPNTVWYGGNTSCVEVRSGREIVVLDAGTGIRELGKELIREFAGRRARLWILVSHTHWDHIQGFPFFGPAYEARHRIRILGWRGSREGLKRTVAAAVETPYFPVALREMPGNITVEELDGFTFRLGAVRASAAPLNHPGGGVGFRLDTRDGSVAYVPDHEVGPGAPRRRTALRRARAEPAGAPRPSMDQMIQGVDVLIHDAQYTAEEYAGRVGWGHSCVEAVVTLAARSGVRRLVLFHHDPDRDDGQLDVILAAARGQVMALGSAMIVDAAREGMEIRLPERPAPVPG